MAKRSVLTAARLREIIHYNPETGEFAWLERKQGREIKVGWIQKSAYTEYRWHEIGIGYLRYKAHHLAWLYMTGNWPSPEIDHINRNSLDNRFCNLREATRIENIRNTGPKKLYKSNTSGVAGVRWYKFTNRWAVQYKRKHLGYFKTKEEAIACLNTHRVRRR